MSDDREQQAADARAAAEKWRVVGNQPFGDVRYVNCGDWAGLRWVVVVSELPPYGVVAEGGPVLVTVLSPWQDANVMQRGPDAGYLHATYVAEKLCDDRARRNWGDLVALTMTVAFALDRPCDPLADLEVKPW